MALALALLPSVAADPSPRPSRKPDGQPQIYQPYFSDAQRAGLHALSTPLDAAFNASPQTREYELFKAVSLRHASEGFATDRFWGVVSSSFEMKSPVSFAAFFQNAAKAQDRGFDCFVVNPMIGNAAIYASVWEQALVGGHPGMEPVYAFLTAAGYPVNAVQGADTFAFCNYVVGNAKFWQAYFNFCEDVLARLDEEARRGTPAGQCFSGGSGYRRGGDVAMRVFVIERLLGCFLQVASQSGTLAVAFHRATPDDFELKFGRRVGPVLHALYGAKNAAVANGDINALKTWLEARQAIAGTNPRIVWELDDPPAWMPNPHAST